jgi:hypothetical protein
VDPPIQGVWEPFSQKIRSAGVWPERVTTSVGDGGDVFSVRTAAMIPTRTTSDLLAKTWSLLTGQLKEVPRRLLWDNESGIGRCDT